MASVRDRIQAFMCKHKLTRVQMAEALGTSVWTMDAWKYGTTPPAAVAKLMDLLEKYPSVRVLAGATHQKVPRGKPFEKGHPWRFNDERRKQLLAEKRKSVA